MTSCNNVNQPKESDGSNNAMKSDSLAFKSGYTDVNRLNMYYEIHGAGNGLQTMHDRDAKRMVSFKDIPDEQITAVKAPALIIVGDKDVITPEHALELHRLMTHSELAIIPGGHGAYIGEVTTLKPGYKESDFIVPIIERFLED
jgi:pimeloyl-ACP methyl ester carboxylesterase